MLYVRSSSPFWWVDVTIGQKRSRFSTQRPHLFSIGATGTVEVPKRLSKAQAAAKADASAVEQHFVKQQLDRIQLGVFPELSLGEACDRWLAGVRATKSADILRREKVRVNRLLGTLRGASRASASLPASLRLSEINSAMVAELIAKRRNEGLAERTINHEVALLQRLWSLAKDWNVARSPEVNFPKTTVAGKLRYLSEAEEAALLYELWPLRERPGTGHPSRRPRELQQALVDQYDLAVLLLDTGMRYSELATMSWNSVDTQRWRWIELYRSKTDNEGILGLTSRARVVLQARWVETRNSSYIFPAKTHGDASRGHATDGIMKAMLRAGINSPVNVRTLGKATVHTLRDTFASRLSERGVPIQKIQHLLGHSSPVQTMKYAKFSQREAAMEAAEVLNRRAE